METITTAVVLIVVLAVPRQVSFQQAALIMRLNLLDAYLKLKIQRS